MKIVWTIIILSLMSLKVFALNEVVTVTALSAKHENVNVKYDSEIINNQIDIPSLNINDLIQKVNGVYVRKKGLGDRISVAPGSKVDIYTFTKNESLVPIDIYSYRLFISRTNIINGDLTRLGMYSDGIYLGRKYAINTVTQSIAPSESIDAFQIYSFNVVQPIQIQSYTVSEKFTDNGLDLDFNLILENSSEYQVCNIELSQQLPSGKVFESNVCLSPNSSLALNYSDTLIHPIPNIITVESLEVKDNNYQYESISTQKINELDKSMEATSMILDTSLGQFNALGSTENNMTIVRVPYWLETEAKEIILNTDLEITFNTDLIRFEAGKNGNLNINITNKGNHQYDLPLIFTLDSKELSLSQSSLVVKDLYFGQTKSYSITLNIASDRLGQFKATIQIDIGNREYTHEFEYAVAKPPFTNGDKAIQKSVSMDNINQSFNTINVRGVTIKKENEVKEQGVIKGVNVVTKKLNNVGQNNSISNTLLKLGIATFVIFVIIIFILISLW
jgi:hypothetical protein